MSAEPSVPIPNYNWISTRAVEDHCMNSVGFTYYDILGIPSSATPDEVKSAYRAAVLRSHPDVNGATDAENVTTLLNDAYAVLSDAERREQYDSVMRGDGLYDGADDSGEQNWDLYSCDRCGLIDAHLRYARFFRVRSFLNDTRVKADAGVLCAECRSRLAIETLAFSILRGPWNLPRGASYTLRALFASVFGGEMPGVENAEMLRGQGLAYLQRRLTREAKTALTAAQRYEYSGSVALLLCDEEILGTAPLLPEKKWLHGQTAAVCALAVPFLAFVIIVVEAISL
jgi:hypothetical protein